MSSVEPEEPVDVNTEDLSLAGHSDDSMDARMFASVWVKVEVTDEDQEQSDEPEHALRPSTLLQRDREREKETLEDEEEDDGEPRPKRTKRKREPPKKRLKCESCDYATVYKNCLELHVMSHTNEKPYACNYCEYTTRYPTSLSRHVAIQHECKKDDLNTMPLLQCTECPYNTHFKWNLNAHKRKHSLEKKYKCDYCEYTTAYKHNHLKHSKVHNKLEFTYQCDKCPFVTKFEGHITRHLAKIHNEVSDRANRCDKCPFSTKSKWRLNIHKKRSHQEKLLKCMVCDFDTFFMCEFKDHKRNHVDLYRNGRFLDKFKNESLLDGIPRSFENKVIDQPLGPEMDYQNQTQHERDNHYLLDPNCEIEWSTIQVNESADQDRPFQCTMCIYTAKFKASVQRHFQRHHTSHNRPYKCVNCDFCTKTKDQIALHNKRSKSDEVLTCNQCDFATNFKCKFIMHQRSHYPYKCTACDYTCKQKYEIQKHFATIHLGNGLQCQYCDFKATRKESLLSHEAIHTGNKPFKCEDCDYKSVRRSLLDNHIRRNHVNKSEVTIIDDKKIQSLKVAQQAVKETDFAEFANPNAVNGNPF